MRDLAERFAWVLSAALFVVFIALWEASVWLFNIPKIVVPPPSAVAQALWSGITLKSFREAELTSAPRSTSSRAAWTCPKKLASPSGWKPSSAQAFARDGSSSSRARR